MTQLSVNVNKIATLRNARGTNQPHLLTVCKDLVRLGAQGLTVHPRPDERHIRRKDIYDLKEYFASLEINKTELEFNIEGYPSEEFLEMIAEVRPHQCTLVPDPPDVLTSNAGWQAAKQEETLEPVLNRLKDLKVRSSVFFDPADWNSENEKALSRLQPDRAELYTERFASHWGTPQFSGTQKSYRDCGLGLQNLGIELNAGHDLSQKNLADLLITLPGLKEVSIGHALICEALYQGFEATLKSYLNILQQNSSSS